MGSVVVDLAGDPQWELAARKNGAAYVLLAGTDFWGSRPADGLVVVDGRGRYEASLELISRLAPGLTRILVTEREAPRDHELAYRAGTTRILVMSADERNHEALIAEALKSGVR